jgi:hypothetical protein
MPKTKISEFSATPANNTDIDSINIAEGCAPSGINDAIRELMAQLKDFQVGSAGDPVTVGGVLTVQAGSASTPSLTTAGDTNTGMFFPAADTIAFAEGGAEVARFDSGGNLGLGVTPSAWGVFKGFDINSSTNPAAISTGGTMAITSNGYYNGANWIYKNTTTASLYQQQSGAHQWYNAPSGTAGNAITFTQAMTLDASGNLGVGTTSPGQKLHLSNSATNTYIQMNSNTHNGYIGQQTDGEMRLVTGASGSFMTFQTVGSERCRIDSSGNFLVGTATAGLNGATFYPAGSAGGMLLRIARASEGTAQQYVVNSSVVGSVYTTASATTYNTSSDYRLKNITGNLTGYKERLMSLQPKQGTWIVDGSEFRGFLAHEFANPYRASVTGKKDAVDENGNPDMQSMQASSSEVMADLVALVQEQQAIIESLTTRITALEGA